MQDVFLLHRVILLGQVLVDGGLDLSVKRGIFNGAGCVTQKLFRMTSAMLAPA